MGSRRRVSAATPRPSQGRSRTTACSWCPDASGRPAIQELAQKRFASGRTTDFELVRRDIEVAGDNAYELGWYAETDRRQDQAFRMQGRYAIVWKRVAGTWRVHRFLYNFSDARPL